MMNIIFNGLYYIIMFMEKLLGDSVITSCPGGRWVYTFFVILRYGKLGSKTAMAKYGPIYSLSLDFRG